MPEQFQQYTTYDQSLELKELGALQYHHRKMIFMYEPYWIEGEDGNTRTLYGIDIRLETILARAFTSQEMFYELAQHYPLTLQLLANSAAGLTIHTEKNDHLLAFYSADRDPFRAIYAAFKWHLQQQLPKQQ